MKKIILLYILLSLYQSSSSQNIGIGTTTPVYKLDVRGSINTDSVYRITGSTVLSVKGSTNTFVGIGSGNSNTTGGYNTITGYQALYSNTTGSFNTANGLQTLYSNAGGNYNTANGYQALYWNSTGSHNTVSGYQALISNTSGAYNTATGSQVLYYNTSGTRNTAIGYQSLYFNTTGNSNMANGYQALYSNTVGDENMAIGLTALYSNTTGNTNTAIGNQALHGMSSGDDNTAVGFAALFQSANGNSNTVVGAYSGLTNGVVISNSTAIGTSTIVNANDKVRIGNSSVTIIEGQVGWSYPSDGRFKTDVREDVPGLSLINKLRPVSYYFETEKFQRFVGIPDSIINKNKNGNEYAARLKQTGLIAQEVENALMETGYEFAGLHKPENPHDNYSIAYDNLIPILIKGIQEQQKQIEELKKQNTDLLKRIQVLESSSISK